MPVSYTHLSSQASQILQGFQDYAQNQIAAGGSTDFATLVSDYFSQPSVIQQINAAVSSDQVVDRQKLMTNLQAALGNDPALASVASQVSTELANQISAQIAAQLGGNLMRGVSEMCIRDRPSAAASRTASLQCLKAKVFSTTPLHCCFLLRR